MTPHSKGTIDDLSKALTSATPAQLKVLRAKINGLLELGGDGADKGKSTDDWLWDGIVEELAARGLLHAGAASSLQRTNAAKSYAAKAGPVREFLLKAAPGLDESRTALQALGRRVAYCLAESLANWAQVTPSLLLTNVDKAPAAVNECFPGYAAAGLLAKLVRVQQSA